MCKVAVLVARLPIAVMVTSIVVWGLGFVPVPPKNAPLVSP